MPSAVNKNVKDKKQRKHLTLQEKLEIFERRRRVQALLRFLVKKALMNHQLEVFLQGVIK